jgi:hypothetical protein
VASLLDHPDQQDSYLIWALPLLAWAEGDLGELEHAEALAQQVVALARRQEQRLALVDGLRVSAVVAIRTRRWPEAAAALQESLALAHAMPYPYAEAKARWVYGQLETARDDGVAASDQFAQARSICVRLGEGLYRPHIERALATLKQR